MSMIDGGIARSNDDGTKAMDIDSQHSPEMATRAQDLLHAFQHVTSRVAAAKSPSRNVRIVLVSKLKPSSDILSLYKEIPQPAHFGENYLQELQQKATTLPKSIRWHFIGALQTNKCKTLASEVEGLWCVSSVDSMKKADALEKGRVARDERLALADNGNDGGLRLEEKLRIHVQVNTSGEESKSGVEPSEATALCRHVREQCPHLQLAGLMTIGAIARSQATTAETENDDFLALQSVREQVCAELELAKDELELSMGMSEDFEGAIRQGSDEVRIGSTIFGARPPKKDAQVKEQREEGAS